MTDPAPTISASRQARRQHQAPNAERTWWLLDATTKPLGRLASAAAKLLIGKHKPTYVPYLDAGDAVVVINAADVVLTGRKMAQKQYAHYSGYPGGLKSETADARRRRGDMAGMVQDAVAGMLPKNQLGPLMLHRLHVYAGAEHPHNHVTLIKKEI